jgi:type II secretory pathway predicted ATPase ExeA
MSKTTTSSTALSAAEFFGWRRHPFVDLPGDIALENLAVQRDQHIAKRALEFIKVNRSFVIIGTPGAGKTTLARTILQGLDTRSFRPIWLPYAGCNRGGVLRILADRVGLEINRKGLPPLHKLQHHLAFLQKEPGSPFPVIVVDDAQHLEAESLMDLCAILAHPTDQKSLASLILVGDETLDRTLRLECRRAIATRMACTFRMDPLTQDEAKTLLIHRLEAAKAPKTLLADDAMELLAAHSRGNRRDLMNLAIRLCIEAHSREERCVTAELVLATTSIQ